MPICTWEFDEAGNLTIQVPAHSIGAFNDWLSDEYGGSEDEMYVLMDDLDAHSAQIASDKPV